MSKKKNNIKKGRTEAESTNLSRIRKNISKEQIRANDILQQTGCNDRLNNIPIEEFKYKLNKQQFLDVVQLKYQLPIPNLSPQCPSGERSSGERCDTQNAMLSKKEGFVTLRHNKLRDILSALSEQVCHDVVIQPILQPVSDNNLVPSTANTNDSDRLDISAKSFWITGQKTFFYVRMLK